MAKTFRFSNVRNNICKKPDSNLDKWRDLCYIPTFLGPFPSGEAVNSAAFLARGLETTICRDTVQQAATELYIIV